VWTGRCAGTFDMYPHLGSHQGIHYALGYCFAGVPMGTWFGIKAAHRILRRNIRPRCSPTGRSRRIRSIAAMPGGCRWC
jgi:glycine/D-amino acid oxidase-like deaminating enzyme